MWISDVPVILCFLNFYPSTMDPHRIYNVVEIFQKYISLFNLFLSYEKEIIFLLKLVVLLLSLSQNFVWISSPFTITTPYSGRKMLVGKTLTRCVCLYGVGFMMVLWLKDCIEITFNILFFDIIYCFVFVWMNGVFVMYIT